MGRRMTGKALSHPRASVWVEGGYFATRSHTKKKERKTKKQPTTVEEWQGPGTIDLRQTHRRILKKREEETNQLITSNPTIQPSNKNANPFNNHDSQHQSKRLDPYPIQKEQREDHPFLLSKRHTDRTISQSLTTTNDQLNSHAPTNDRTTERPNERPTNHPNKQA